LRKGAAHGEHGGRRGRRKKLNFQHVDTSWSMVLRQWNAYRKPRAHDCSAKKSGPTSARLFQLYGQVTT
jgi:hypothetical protein